MYVCMYTCTYIYIYINQTPPPPPAQAQTAAGTWDEILDRLRGQVGEVRAEEVEDEPVLVEVAPPAAGGA